MNTMVRLSTLALAVLPLAATATAPARAECKSIGAVGTGINEGIAKFMADAALKNIRESGGYAPSGATKYKCEAGMISTDCHASQKVCK